MKDHQLYPLASRLRPELNTLNGGALLQAFSEVLTVLYLTPIATIGMVWLILSDTFVPSSHDIFLLGLVVVGLLVTNSQTAIIYVRVGSKEKLALSSSLGSVVQWAGFLLWGTLAVWASLIADTITSIVGVWRMKRLNLNMFWGPLSSFLQNLALLPGILFALWIYKSMGGAIPFSSVKAMEWLPALVAIAISSIFPSIVILPVFNLVTSLAGAKNATTAAVQFIISAVAFTIIPAPFGIPLALLFVKAGAWPFIAMAIGVVLVNYLAHHLSRTNQRNIQQAQEMEQLEKLGEEILKSSPDGAELANILHKRINSMFSDQLDIIALHIFDDMLLPGYSGQNNTLNMIRPDPALTPDKLVWEMLRKSKNGYELLKNQVPNGFNEVYGDALLVKILSAEPVSEKHEPVCLGGIYLLMNKTVSRTIDSLSALQALASQIASALYRAQVYEETLAAHKMSQELAFAGKIQASFLPESVPSVDGWEIAASLIPARETSGDFYDFIELPGGKLGILIADVADKGTGAALYMALCRTLLRTFAYQHPDAPAEVFRLTNDRLFTDSRANQFVTVFYGVLNYATGHFEYCNAGHNPTLLLRANSENTQELLKRTGTVIGATEGLIWTSASATLNPGDFLLFYTDGVVEAQNEQDEFFSDEQLLECAKTHSQDSAEMIHDHIKKKLQSFIGNAAQFDDITMMIVKRQALFAINNISK